MKNTGSIEALALSDAPTRTERVLSDRKARVLRETALPITEQIPCPGLCGGVAALVESPLSVTRGGVTRVIRVAQCQGECRMEARIGRTGKTRPVPARFDIPWEPEVPRASIKEALVDEGEALPLRLARAMRLSGLTQCEAAERIGCSQSGVSKLLHGTTMAKSTQTAALRWVESVEQGGEQRGKPALNPPLALVSASPIKVPSETPLAQSCQKEPLMQDISSSLESRSEPELRVVTAQRPESPLLESVPRSDHPVVSHSEPEPQAACLPALGKLISNPYEAILRSLLEPAAQRHLAQIAGPAAANIVVRVSLEWDGDPVMSEDVER